MLITELGDARPAIVGLGYVGLPLAVEFGRRYPTIGFDINVGRVDELRRRRDSTLEVSAEELAAATHLTYSTQLRDLANCNVYIVTVPTPIDAYKRPDMGALAVRQQVHRGSDQARRRRSLRVDCLSGATEEVCLPIIEKTSGLRFNVDFLRGLQPGANQSGRQAASPHDRSKK
jgi:UDP-N-acetyl-D-galactosamine dehydrogenase